MKVEVQYPYNRIIISYNRKGFVTFTVIGNYNSVVRRLYFYLHGEKQRCMGRNFFNKLPAFPRYAMYELTLLCMSRLNTARKKDIKISPNFKTGLESVC